MPVKQVRKETLRVPIELSHASLHDFDEAVDSALRSGITELRLDCSLLERVASEHIGLIFRTVRRSGDQGVKVVLHSVTASLTRVLHVLDLDIALTFDGAAAISIPEIAKQKPYSYGTQVFEAACGTGLDSATAILRSFQEFVSSLDLSVQQSIELETVFYEILTNIRNHGELSPSQQITVSAQRNESNLSLSFSDPGVQFNPTQTPSKSEIEEALRAGKPNGYGLTMIARMTDTMEYRRTEEGQNILTVTKYLAKDEQDD